jgi:redox-sensitive bicupin YhaK (pirin superfamily)
MKSTTGEIQIRRSDERGRADHGWLQARHSFSFADYHEPAHPGFRTLRVLNEDVIAPGRGFGTHPHRDMEIFSYLLEGALEHKDSLGNGRILRPGQIQLMSAGRGVTHSEFNPSRTDPAHLLQIWIQPRARGLAPSYHEWQPANGQGDAAQTLLISADGREGSATIQQDADIHRVLLQSGQTTTHELRAGRGAWLQIVRGALTLDGTPLAAGDGASTEQPGLLTLTATQATEALLFDLN